MGVKIDIGDAQYDAMFGFLLLNNEDRRKFMVAIQREAVKNGVRLTNELRAQAVAAECQVLKFTPEESLNEILRRERKDWAGTLDEHRMSIRLIYERLHEGPQARSVPGFKLDQLEVLERSLAQGDTAHESAILIWQDDRRRGLQKGTKSSVADRVPQLFLRRETLPAGTVLSASANPFRRYEPVVIDAMHAYPASSAWMVLPRDVIKTFTHEVASWMRKNWPEGHELCDNANDHLAGYDLDRENTILAAEALVRGLTIEEAASFVFEQRLRQDEAA